MTRFDGSVQQESNAGESPRLEGEAVKTDLESVPDAPEPKAPVPKSTDSKEEAPSVSESTPVSSSDLTSSFPLKERNFLPKPRESISFDPREPFTRSSLPDGGKENATAPHSSEDNIQCNEISSSNIDLDDENAVDSSSRSHNLRSGKKAKPEASVKVPKRKLEPEPSVAQPRKSLRIDHIQKKAVEAGKSEAGGKSKAPKPKPSIAQKILKCKNINLKKKHLTKKPIAKKKIQLFLDAIRGASRPKGSKPVPKPKAIKEKKKAQKRTCKASKVKNQSQRKSNGDVTTGAVVKGRKAGSSNVPVKAKASRRSLRNVQDVAEPKKVKLKAIRKRIQRPRKNLTRSSSM